MDSNPENRSTPRFEYHTTVMIENYEPECILNQTSRPG
jgi:hypothetical protein